MKIVLTPHAVLKLGILKEHGFALSAEKVLDTVENPEKVAAGRKGRKIAQKVLDDTHVLRVVYEEKDDHIEVVTLYPARRNRYEDQL